MKVSRTSRLNGEFQKEISEIIRTRLKDREPELKGLISVTETDVAPDLKTAKVYVSIYGDPDKCDATFAALVSCAGFIRHELSVDFRDLRVVPQLTFIRDTSEAYSEKINAILEELKKE